MDVEKVLKVFFTFIAVILFCVLLYSYIIL